MRQASHVKLWWLAVLGLGLSGSLHAANEIREYLDEKTAATIVAASHPLVFARERPDLAVNARDYVTLVPVQVNRSGKRTSYWFAYLWSTIDRLAAPPPDGRAQLVLLADGRPIALRVVAGTLREAGIDTTPIEAPVRSAVALLFAADVEVLEYVTNARQLSVLHLHDDRSEQFDSWRVDHEALRAFLRRVSSDN